MAYLGGHERERIRSLARTRPGEAIEAARRAPDLWTRVQSLAIAAWFLDDAKQAATVAREALRAAAALEIPNRVVSVSAWPVRVLVAREPAAVGKAVQALLALIDGEPNPVRRADALILLLAAVFSDARQRELVLRALVSACAATRAWKASWVLYRAVMMVASADRPLAATIAEQIGDERRKRRALRDLARYTGGNAPELFWWADESG